MSSQICPYNNLHSFSFIEPAKSSFSNNLQGSNCTVNAQIITNLELALQKNNSSVTDFSLCYYTNAQSFMNKHDEFMNTVIDVINPHIMGITLDGYTIYRKDQECAKGGGVLLYVSNNLESNYCSTLNIHKFNDSIWCIVNLHNY